MIFLLLLFLFHEVSLKVTVLVPYYSICVLILSYNSFDLKNISSLASLPMINLFQFADDATVVTTSERGNKLLLNCFTKWFNWSDMIIRVVKCDIWDQEVFFTISPIRAKAINL